MNSKKIMATMLLFMLMMAVAVEAFAENSGISEMNAPAVVEQTLPEATMASETVIVTPVPVVSSSPAATDAHETAEMPEATEHPQETATLEPTQTPEASATPDPTLAPIVEVNEVEYLKAYVLIKEGTATVYAEPSTGSEIVARLGRGAMVTVVSNGDWALIEIGGAQGYLSGGLLSFEPVSDLPGKKTSPTEGEAGKKAEQEADDSEDTDGAKQEETAAPRTVNIYCMDSGIAYGDMVTLASKLEGFDGVAVALQWQRLTTSGEWVNVSGANGEQYSFVMTEELEGVNWRLEVVEIEN